VGLVLDSSILVEAERRGRDLRDLIRQITVYAGNVPIAICAVTVAELAHGVHRANTPERRLIRRSFLDRVKMTLPVHAVTAATAEVAGRIDAECAARGINLPLDDLLIAACAIELNYAVATRNRRHFDAIPGLELISL